MSLKITYNLSLPSPLPSTTTQHEPKYPSSQILSYPLSTSTNSIEIMKSIEIALNESRKELNEILTDWKEVVGGLESHKIIKKVKKNEDDDGEDEQEEEE